MSTLLPHRHPSMVTSRSGQVQGCRQGARARGRRCGTSGPRPSWALLHSWGSGEFFISFTVGFMLHFISFKSCRCCTHVSVFNSSLVEIWL